MDRVLPYGPGGLLSDEELALLECAANGDIWHPKAGKFPNAKCKDFQKSEWLDKPVVNPDELKKFIIRPEVIRCLITGTPWDDNPYSPHHQPWPLHARGVLISNAWIGKNPEPSKGNGFPFEDNLQLDGCTLLGQLWLVHCEIAGFVNLQDAHTKTLGFSGSRIIKAQKLKGPFGSKRAFNGRRLDVDGDVFLRDGFRADAVVLLAKSKINGSLHCEGGIFSAHKKAFKDKRKMSEGDSCSHAPGDTNSYVALDGSAAEIHGNVLLCSGFVARGGVDFSYAKIDGGLRCTGGHFISLYRENRSSDKIEKSDHTEYIALNCRFATIRGNVSLMCGYKADGSSDFMYACIGNSLRCKGGTFQCCLRGVEYYDLRVKYESMGDLIRSDYDALNLYGAKVDGGLYLTKIDNVIGTISLQKTTAHGLHDDGTAWLENPDICFILSGFFYDYARWKSKFRPCKSCSENRSCRFWSGSSKSLAPEVGNNLAEHVHKWLQNQPRVRKVRTFLECCLGETVAGFLRRIPYVFHGRLHDAALGTQTYLDDPQQFRDFGQLEYDANTRSWVQASRVLRNMGERKAARQLSFLREVYRTDLIQSALLRFLRRMLLGYPVGYGYKPMQALWAVALVTLVCGFFYTSAGNYGYMQPSQGDVIVHMSSLEDDKPLPVGYTQFNGWIYALDSLLPVVELGQTSAWEPAVAQCEKCASDQLGDWAWLRGQAYQKDVHPSPFWKAIVEVGWLRILHWLEIIFGWWLFAAGIANFSRIIGKED